MGLTCWQDLVRASAERRSRSAKLSSRLSQQSSLWAQLLLRERPEDLVNDMCNRRILGGWDAVCCMDASAVNTVLKKNYEEELNFAKKT